jgi:hypothetical protein
VVRGADFGNHWSTTTQNKIKTIKKAQIQISSIEKMDACKKHRFWQITKNEKKLNEEIFFNNLFPFVKI